MAKPALGLSPPEPFSFNKPEEWNRWIRRFERFRAASGLTEQSEAAQLNMLIYSMGDQADDILQSFTFNADKGENEKSYESVKKKFNEHFIPKRNVIYERAMFNSRKQQPGEPVDSFVTSLYTLVERCDYKGLRDEMIRDRIVVGICDAKLSEKLQLDRELTLETAVTQVRQKEVIRQQQSTLRGSGGDDTVAAVHKERAPRDRSNREENCPWCGRAPKHDRQYCPAREANCRKCGKRGHYQVVCRSTAKVSAIQEMIVPDAFLGAVATDNYDERWTIILQLNNKSVKFCIDTGADVSLISEQVWKKIGKPPLQPSDRNLKCPDTHSLSVRGMLTAQIKSQSNQVQEPIYIVRGLTRSLLGKPAIEHLNLISRIDAVNEQELNPFTQFPKLFTGLGELQGDYNIQLEPGAKPFAISTPRRVAVPLLPAVKEELQRMESLGVIKKVEEPTDWCAGMVVVPKEKGKVRICVDLSRLNQSVKRELHPLPVVDQVLAQLTGAKVMSKLDANSGFWQIPLSPESAKLTTFITPFGRYCFHRLPFGISSAPEHFQRRMSDILTDIPGVVCMMDDILIHGKTREEHDVHLRDVLNRLQDAGMTLNKEKCQFAQTSLKFLGHIIDSDGIRPDPDKVQAIQDIQTPANVGDVRRYLGMVNHLSKFAPNLAEVTQPMRELLVKKNTWIWGDAQQKAFEETKKLLTESPVLTLFDPNHHTVVSADASSFGLGAVLLQKSHQEEEYKPVAFISRSMTQTEQRYAQIEKEALAFTWACERLSDYLTGLKFHIWTDHKPLVPLFSTKELEQVPIRVQRFRLRMMRYNFTISHVPGKTLTTADTLSRSTAKSLPNTEDDLEQECDAYVKLVMQSLPATERRMKQIKESQQRDETCQLVSTYCLTSWPDKKSAPFTVLPYLPLAAEFSIVDGILMRGSRIVIPKSLQKELLERIHTSGHQGINKCRERARQSVWWPGLSTQLEELVKACRTCCIHQQQRAEPLIPSELPELPWQKVGTDLFEWKNHSYLLIVDYYSRFIEIALLNQTTAQEVIRHTKSIFARHGIPELVISDNGPQYTSDAYEEFSKEYQFQHETNSPYFPQSNGEAERAVKIIKEMLKKNDDPYLAILAYRTTPIQGGQYSPAELLMNRMLRTTLPTTRKQRVPQVPDQKSVKTRDEREKLRQKHNFDKHHGTRPLPAVQPGTKVWIPAKQMEGTVHEEVAPRSLTVTTEEGSELRRNRRDLIQLPTETPTQHEQEQPPTNSPQKEEIRRSTRPSVRPTRFAPFVEH